MQGRLELKTYSVSTLIEDYTRGRLVIPEFQRDYVWKPARAAKLVDSLYHGFPISSLLIWESHGEVKTRRANPRRASGPMTSWLIDGQQRVITLTRCLTGEDGIDVVFNSKTQEFIRANAATRKDPDCVRVSDIWDDQSFRRIRRNIESDVLEERLERVRGILRYEVPAVHMVEHTFHDAVTAFSRINTLGAKLKKKDIESAQVAAKHSGFIRDKVTPKLAELHQNGFERLDVAHLFRACSFVAQPERRHRIPLHEMSTAEVTAAWQKTIRGLDQAVDLVRSELGVVNMSILWSGALLVPPIVLCATRGPRDRNDTEIAGWIALAALLHRYSGATGTNLDQDLRACRQADPVGALLKNLREVRPSLRAEERDFRGSLADRGGLFAVYLACRQNGCTDLFTSRKILLQEQIDRHHILPRAQFPLGQRHAADTLANIAFIVSDTNRSIGAASPDVYLGQIDGAVLESQCIPRDQTCWQLRRAPAFWEMRRKKLATGFNAFIDEALAARTPKRKRARR